MEQFGLYLLLLAALALIVTPLVRAFQGKDSASPKARKALRHNLVAFSGVMFLSILLPVGGLVSAADAGSMMASNQAAAFFAAALSTGLCAIGAAIAVSKAAPAAIGAISENPKTFGNALVFAALGEGLGVFGLLVSIMILNKV